MLVFPGLAVGCGLSVGAGRLGHLLLRVLGKLLCTVRVFTRVFQAQG